MKAILREWRKSDTDSLVLLANNKKISDNLRDQFPHPYLLQDAKSWISLNEKKDPPNSFVIDLDGELIGGCGVFRKEDVYRRSAEIGYWIGEPFWGRGIATEAIKQLLEKTVLLYPDLARVYAEVFAYNKASMRVLEKNGFYLESTRKNAVVKNGKLMDDCVWVKLL